MNTPNEDSNPDDIVEAVKALQNAKASKDKFKHILAQYTGNKTSKPYYKERFAYELKPVLDSMMQDKKDRLFRFEVFSSVSPNSLHMKIYQAWSYLIDFLDPDGVYAELKEQTKITNIRKVGIKIYWVVGEEAVVPLVAEPVERSNIMGWRNEVISFIENGQPGKKLILENLLLTDENIEEVKMMIFDIPTIIGRITNSTIKLIKKEEPAE